MDVYSLPSEVPFAEPDYANYCSEREQQREDAHRAQLKAWLISSGYAGPLTGSILQEPQADGYAQYMFADGAPSCLIHLPHGDAWNSPNVQYLPEQVVRDRIGQQSRLAAIFASKAA